MGGKQRRVKASKQHEMEQAFLKHLNLLYGYAVALTRDPMDAEDLVQATWERALENLQAGETVRHLPTWLCTVLRNIWRNQYRRQQHGPQFLSLGTMASETGACKTWEVDHRQRPDILFEQKALQEQLLLAIGNLPEALREVLVLRSIHGLKYSQIAEIVACPVGTVMSRLHRARADVSRHLDNEINPFLV